MARLTFDEITLKLKQRPHSILAAYSTWWGGVLPKEMNPMIPMEDHLVHRGDGVFEAMKSIKGRLWLLDAHLDRLFFSAQGIGLKIPCDRQKLRELLAETADAIDEPAYKNDYLVRLYVSRGPGSFGVSPYDSKEAHIHIILTQFKSPEASLYKTGVKVMTVKLEAKASWLAQIKSCNYLQNVLVKKEALDAGFEYGISVTSEGFMTESSTENLLILDKDGVFVQPEKNIILQGTTMGRFLQLAEKNGYKTAIRNFHESEVLKAQGVFRAGTTLDILPVGQWNAQALQVHPKINEFLQWLQKDQV